MKISWYTDLFFEDAPVGIWKWAEFSFICCWILLPCTQLCSVHVTNSCTGFPRSLSTVYRWKKHEEEHFPGNHTKKLGFPVCGSALWPWANHFTSRALKSSKYWDYLRERQGSFQSSLVMFRESFPLRRKKWSQTKVNKRFEWIWTPHLGNNPCRVSGKTTPPVRCQECQHALKIAPDIWI